jgi:tRNA(fMet)-specific endonuclease VapC
MVKRYLLDTSPLVALIKGRAGAERLIRPWIRAQEAATSVLAYGEAIEHFRTQPEYARNYAALRTLLRAVTPLRITYAVMERYADLRLHLRPQGGLIGDVDTLIAATALEHGLTVVTIDPDFDRLTPFGLSVMRLERAALRQ